MQNAANEIAATRTFHAPRALVFQMWTQAEHLANWWGPLGFRLTTSEFEFREGGAWRFVMHGPDGTDYKNEIVFREIDAPNRISYSHTNGPLFDATATFEDQGDQTLVTVVMTFETVEQRERVMRSSNAGEGLRQTLDRLGEQVAEAFTIARTFDAPRELVFRAWTEVAHLRHWWGPQGFEVTNCTVDLRPGGTMHYGMRGPDGASMWGLWTFRDVVPPELLVFVSSFSDEHGGVTRAPFFDGGWPLRVLSAVTFEERDGKTLVTMVGNPIDATDAERNLFKEMHTSMQGGWTGTLDQLTSYLEKYS
jgi:uncharacterized protein YndB with AHSA1/START domain